MLQLKCLTILVNSGDFGWIKTTIRPASKDLLIYLKFLKNIKKQKTKDPVTNSISQDTHGTRIHKRLEFTRVGKGDGYWDEGRYFHCSAPGVKTKGLDTRLFPS